MESYKVYASRFHILFLFALSSAANAFLWISFAPIYASAASWFSVSSGAINWLSLVFMVVYLPGSLLAAVSMERLGLRATLLLGAGGNAVGAATVRVRSDIADPLAYLVLCFGNGRGRRGVIDKKQNGGFTRP